MDLRISLADDVGDDQAGLESLLDWLQSEPRLAGLIAKEHVRPSPGQMGALPGALLVSAGSAGGGALSMLALALKAWLSQPRHANIKIRIQGDDGEIQDITADHIKRNDAADIIRQVLKDRSLDTEDADS